MFEHHTFYREAYNPVIVKLAVKDEWHNNLQQKI